MCGKAYDPRLIVAWPTSELAVMSGASAAKTLLQIEVSTMKARGEEITESQEKELFDKIKNRYDEQISPYYAAARLWTDAIIDPADTRSVLAQGIAVANHNKSDQRYNVGVIQT
jgi:acetyl-CoA carboxylase carboxyltransferase component